MVAGQVSESALLEPKEQTPSRGKNGKRKQGCFFGEGKPRREMAKICDNKVKNSRNT